MRSAAPALDVFVYFVVATHIIPLVICYPMVVVQSAENNDAGIKRGDTFIQNNKFRCGTSGTKMFADADLAYRAGDSTLRVHKALEYPRKAEIGQQKIPSVTYIMWIVVEIRLH
eukprot:6397111-Prymnesium_polylepis.1